MDTWRQSAAPIIAKVIYDFGPCTDPNDKELRRKLREAYPWGERAMWPYKVWCDEVRRQLGAKKRKRDPKQGELF